MSLGLRGSVAQLRRHPVKGFTPERLPEAVLHVGGHFPCDRIYAVERGVSGFDPAAPRHVSKWRFTVLANHARLAELTTVYDEQTCRISVSRQGRRVLQAELGSATGRDTFAAWLADFLGDEEAEVLRVAACAPRHRFTDDENGFVSLVNLQSVRALEAKIGVPLDPLRLRANIYVDGWPAWCEREAKPGVKITLGDIAAQVVGPIPRCVATHVDPATGVRDLDVVGLLREHYGHVDCGLYLRVIAGGRVCEGDAAELC